MSDTLPNRVHHKKASIEEFKGKNQYQLRKLDGANKGTVADVNKQGDISKHFKSMALDSRELLTIFYFLLFFYKNNPFLDLISDS